MSETRNEFNAISERSLIARYPYGLAVYAELHASLGRLEMREPT